MAAKATTTIRQGMHYQPEHAAWFAANQVLFNQVAAFYFEVIQAHEKILDLKDQDALPALEKLTHATKKNPHPVMPLSSIGKDIPAMFRRAAIHAALGSARSFYAHLKKWRTRRAKVMAKGKKFLERPTRPAAFLEQVSHLLLRPVERTQGIIHPAQSLDRKQLELAQSAPHWSRTAEQGRSGKSRAYSAGRSMVVAYSG